MCSGAKCTWGFFLLSNEIINHQLECMFQFSQNWPNITWMRNQRSLTRSNHPPLYLMKSERDFGIRRKLIFLLSWNFHKYLRRCYEQKMWLMSTKVWLPHPKFTQSTMAQHCIHFIKLVWKALESFRSKFGVRLFGWWASI